MLDNGQIEKWTEKYWSNNDSSIPNCDNNNNPDSAPPIDLKDIEGVFLCIGGFVTLSILFLIMEVIWTRWFQFK